ncbi:DUF6436 domain-containing protein [Aestuariibacter salexigens]|uniref:DUF6436 domain-containing protein n=1 Tax=Aestuariibacter salexigens TaxID=226010 RepID=UPI00047E59F1|nr:DUF6436 domain-containing protein [Aestuariibacter salexigens]
MKSGFIILLAILWLGIVMAVLKWQQSSMLIEFDPELQLLSDLASLEQELLPYHAQHRLTTIHITADDCICDFTSRQHRHSVAQLAEQQGFHNVFINLAESGTESIATVLPALPAVAVFENGELTYFGPYSSGIYCSAGNGLVEPWLTRETDSAAFSMPDTVIPYDAEGCYCRPTK